MTKSSIPPAWIEQLTAFKRFASAAELAVSHPPSHKERANGTEIWHYPLGVSDGTMYAIHVAVTEAGAPMAYMHMVPTDLPATIAPGEIAPNGSQPQPPRPWWRFW